MKVVIAGGGLVGALGACVLGQKGHDVELYEYRQDPRSAEGRLLRGRSINLALSTRGRATLARAGLEELVLAQAIPMKGRMLHSVDGTKKEVLYDPNGNQCIYSVSRRFLNELLLTEAEKCTNVSLRFSHKLLNCNLDKGIVKFRRKHGNNESEIEIQADLVIGADGAHSAMRQSMLKCPMTNYSQTYIEHGYVELCIPEKANGEHAMEKNYLHIWPRSRFMLIALPNQDGSFTVTLFMPFEIFEQLRSADSIETFFSQQFPDAMQLIGKANLVRDMLSSKPSPLISIKCSPLNSGRTVLVGDAAHAMVPFYGQGMNAGFEDIFILDDLLTSCSNEGVENCLIGFNRARSADAQAICELAMYNYLEMRHLVNQKGFYLRRITDLLLNKVFGTAWVPLYNHVTFSRTPYSECIQHKKWQDEVLKKVRRCTLMLLAGCLLSTFIYPGKFTPLLSAPSARLWETFVSSPLKL